MKRLTGLPILAILFCSSIAFTQESIMFDKQFVFDNHGSYPRYLKQTPDGGYICGGGIGFGMYDERYLLFKTDSLGDLEWYKYQDSSSIKSNLYAVDITKTGNYVGIGTTQDNVDWHSSGAIVYYNELGDTIWTRQYAFPQDNSNGELLRMSFNDGLYTMDNAIIAAGSIEQIQHPQAVCPLIVKVDMNGDTLWTWRYVDSINTVVIESVAETAEGDYIAVGRANKPVIDDYKTYAPQRGFIIKLSQNGELIYLKEWTDLDYNYFTEVAINSSEELIISGIYFHHPPEYPDDECFGFVLKTDNCGNTVFYDTICYGFGLTGVSVNTTSLDGIVFIGTFAPPISLDWEQDVLMRKYSSEGDLLWTKYIGGKDVLNWPHSVITTKDGGVAFCGLYSYQQNYSWLVKTDSLGNGPYEEGWINAIDTHEIDNELIIYPNPADQYFSIILLSDFLFNEVIIYNMNGQIVKTHTDINPTVDISSLQNGIYFIKLIGNEKIIVKKLIVKH